MKMPEITFEGEPAQAPVGMELWEPGETREVSDEEAERLLGNANFRAAQSDALEERAAARAPQTATRTSDRSTAPAQQ